MKSSMMNTFGISAARTAAGAFSVAVLASGAAHASPLAAAVASTPLVVGGILVGLALLVGFTLVLLRSVRSMKAAQGEDRVELARKEAERVSAEFSTRPSVEALKVLVDELREASSDQEARVYAGALSRLTGRYFGEDDLAWEVWLRRDASAYVAALVNHTLVNTAYTAGAGFNPGTHHSGIRERTESLPVSG